MPIPKQPVTPFVQDRKTYGENLLTREMHPTDGNMMGFEDMYGQARPDTTELQIMPIDQTVKRFREMYGDEQALQVLDELVRIQEQSLSMNQNPTEIESFGRARRNPTDSNLMTHEHRYGYPPSVAALPPLPQTPFGPKHAMAAVNKHAAPGGPVPPPPPLGRRIK